MIYQEDNIMSKIVNISEEKFRKALRSIVKEEENIYNNYEVFNDQENAMPNPNDRTLDNHDEGLPGKMDYETFDKQLPGAADFPI